MSPTSYPTFGIPLEPTPSPVLTYTPTYAPTNPIVLPPTGPPIDINGPPLVTLGTFNNAMTKISIMFDIETNFGNIQRPTRNFDCRHVFILSQSDYLGRRSICKWINRYELVIILRGRFNIQPGDSLILRNIIQDKWEWYDGIYQVFTVYVPSDLLPPVSIIVGTNNIGMCDVLTLVGSNSVRSIGTPKWTLIQPNNNLNNWNIFLTHNQTDITMNSYDVFGEYTGDIIISLTVFNAFGVNHTSFHTIYRNVIIDETPIVRFDHSNVILLNNIENLIINSFVLESNNYCLNSKNNENSDNNSSNRTHHLLVSQFKFEWSHLYDQSLINSLSINEIPLYVLNLINNFPTKFRFVNASLDTLNLRQRIKYSQTLGLNALSFKDLNGGIYILKFKVTHIYNSNIYSIKYLFVIPYDRPIIINSNHMPQISISVDSRLNIFCKDLFKWPRQNVYTGVILPWDIPKHYQFEWWSTIFLHFH